MTHDEFGGDVCQASLKVDVRYRLSSLAAANAGVWRPSRGADALEGVGSKKEGHATGSAKDYFRAGVVHVALLD